MKCVKAGAGYQDRKGIYISSAYIIKCVCECDLSATEEMSMSVCVCVYRLKRMDGSADLGRNHLDFILNFVHQ